jgi:hypothetical protein
MPLTYVRVRDKSNGHHYTVLAQEVEASPDAYEVLKQDAVNANGDPLPGEIPEGEDRDEEARYEVSVEHTHTTEGQSATENTKET